MTNEEAIKILKSKMDGSVDTSYEWAETVRMAIKALEQPTIEPRCETCEAFNKTRLLISQPERTGRWINHVEDGYVECPFCHSATNCDDNISELHFCFSCGARMEDRE